MRSVRDRELTKSPTKHFLRGRHERIYDSLDRFGEMESDQVANILGVTRSNATQVMVEMVTQGILDRRKNGKTFIYFIPKRKGTRT